MNRFELLAEVGKQKSEIRTLQRQLQDDGGENDTGTVENGIEAVRSDAGEWIKRIESLLQSAGEEMDLDERERWEDVLGALLSVADEQSMLMDVAAPGAPRP